MLTTYLGLLMCSGLTLAIPATNVGQGGAQVTNPAAFTSGAGNKDISLNTGAAASDSYTCHSGGWQSFPDNTKWVSFAAMFDANKPLMKSGCGGLNVAADTDEQIGQLYNAILQVSKASLVDPRFGLAIVMQESFGCVNVGTTNNGVSNPGLMQTHNGSSFVGNSATPEAQQASITAMVVDGLQGTSSGDGLAQLINKHGNIYEAARDYNSGSVDVGNLNDPMGATASYVNDVANRMTGWVNASPSKC